MIHRKRLDQRSANDTVPSQRVEGMIADHQILVIYPDFEQISLDKRPSLILPLFLQRQKSGHQLPGIDPDLVVFHLLHHPDDQAVVGEDNLVTVCSLGRRRPKLLCKALGLMRWHQHLHGSDQERARNRRSYDRKHFVMPPPLPHVVTSEPSVPSSGQPRKPASRYSATEAFV